MTTTTLIRTRGILTQKFAQYVGRAIDAMDERKGDELITAIATMRAALVAKDDAFLIMDGARVLLRVPIGELTDDG
ncbi:MAG: hypothetical protein ABR529_11675 [Actinomycetota bacterium]